MNFVEIMIIACIVAILGAVAVPAYLDYSDPQQAYERKFPCINGVRYIRGRDSASYTPLLDPVTGRIVLCTPKVEESK